MPVVRWAQRARRPIAAGFVAAVAGAVVAAVVRSRKTETQVASVCHPNLSHLRGDEDGQEVLLIGTLPLDLEGASRALVRSSLDVLRPDVVMVEGTWTAGLSAMFFSGTWELHGLTPPGGLNWTDIGDAKPMEIVVQRPKKGFLGLGGGPPGPPPPKLPARSLVPLKVRNWAYHLLASVGAEVAAAVTAAAASGVPVRFLGPADGGGQGHVLVNMLARTAAMELLQEEHQHGSQLSNTYVDDALRRAEAHVREDAGKWLRDARAETRRFGEHMQSGQVPAHIRSFYAEQSEARQEGTASRIKEAMQAFKKGAAVLPVDQLVGVEARLLQAGYSFVSQCA